MNPRMNRFRPRTLRFIETPPAEGEAPATTKAAETPAETPPPAEGEAPAEKPAEEEKPAEGETLEEAAKVAELPDWAQSEMRRLRTESAARRVRERELTEKLDAAKSPEEFETVVSEMRAENAALKRTATIGELTRTHHLSASAVEMLADVADDKLATFAQKLAGLSVPAPGTRRDPSGGIVPDDDDEPFDPVATARKARASRR